MQMASAGAQAYYCGEVFVPAGSRGRILCRGIGEAKPIEAESDLAFWPPTKVIKFAQLPVSGKCIYFI